MASWRAVLRQNRGAVPRNRLCNREEKERTLLAGDMLQQGHRSGVDAIGPRLSKSFGPARRFPRT
jgi:hypothetical protein